MYETQTSDVIEKRMLADVDDSYDKREGSIIYDATAPASIELGEAYIMADTILKQTFATTADRDYLILRAAEFNITPNDATYAVVKAVFNQAVSIGSRFNSGTINFKVTALLDDTTHSYSMTCETAGTTGNSCIGSITPIGNISGLTSASITELITPAEDVEDTETFRARYFKALKSQAYGGNGADYQEKVTAISGVGGVKVYRCWNGGGTVKCVVLDSDYSIPNSDFIATLQNDIDPTPQGAGEGIAPIGHTVTVVGATSTTVNVAATVSTKTGTVVADVQAAIKTAINTYFTTLRKNWCDQSDKEYLTVRTAYIQSAVLAVTGVTDITATTINGASDKVDLDTAAVPTLGTLTLTQG